MKDGYYTKRKGDTFANLVIAEMATLGKVHVALDTDRDSYDPTADDKTLQKEGFLVHIFLEWKFNGVLKSAYEVLRELNATQYLCACALERTGDGVLSLFLPYGKTGKRHPFDGRTY